MKKRLLLVLLIAISVLGLQSCRGATSVVSAPASAPDPCQVASVQKLSTTYENLVASTISNLSFVSQQDSNGIFQIYSKDTNNTLTCITCTQVSGGPAVNLNKFMPSIHPSGKWLVVGVEETTHPNQNLPQSVQDGYLESGLWLNIWITTPTGDHWYQVTNFNGPATGFTGVPFTPDGHTGVWAQLVTASNLTTIIFGQWKLYAADFVIQPDGSPAFANQRDITPAGALWVEPGNFSPDGIHVLISTDIGLGAPGYAQGQDQWAVNIFSGALQQLTNTPKVWDEHGVYSPNGQKIVFMSSDPYQQSDPNSYLVIDLKTEFMLMNSDGSGLKQLTHFNTPGYPESISGGNTIAAVAQFMPDGSLFATVLAPNNTKTNWSIKFQGTCGTQ